MKKPKPTLKFNPISSNYTQTIQRLREEGMEWRSIERWFRDRGFPFTQQELFSAHGRYRRYGKHAFPFHPQPGEDLYPFPDTACLPLFRYLR